MGKNYYINKYENISQHAEFFSQLVMTFNLGVDDIASNIFPISH